VYDANVMKNSSKNLDILENGVGYVVKTGLKDVRTVRMALLDLADFVADSPAIPGVLVLEEPEISGERLHEEWDWIERLLKSSLYNRIGMVLLDESRQVHWISRALPVASEDLEEVVAHMREKNPKRMRRPSEAYLEVLRVLLVQAYQGNKPVTAKWLGEACGYSHPTITKALERLEPFLESRTDKQNRFRMFPKQEWLKLLADADTIRSTRRYVDRTGNPRSQNFLLERLKEESGARVAVAGVLGARHWMPDLDLTGAPRLELVIHEENPFAFQKLLRRLDPGLEEAERGEAPHLVLHSLYRSNPFFSGPDEGFLWADPIECLLDLYAARLESQADDMLQKLMEGCRV